MKHYRRGYAKQCEPPEWISQYEAAAELSVHIFRIGLLIANNHLEAAETASREMGVTRKSLNREKEWRASSSTGKRLWRAVKDSLNYF